MRGARRTARKKKPAPEVEAVLPFLLPWIPFVVRVTKAVRAK